MQFLVTFALWLAGSLVARLLVGAGLAVGFHTWVSGAVEDFLAEVVSAISGIGGDAGQMVLLSGAGPALSIIGGALVARAAIVAAGAWIGRAS